MRTAFALAIMAATVAGLTACDRPQGNAKTADARVPAQVRQWEAAAGEACRRVGGRFEGVENHYLTGDFNGDGATDYLMRWSGVECVKPGATSAFGWGEAGPDNDFLISNGETWGLVEGFQGAVDQADIKRRGQVDVVELEGRPGEGVARVVWGLKDGQMAIIERQGTDGGQVDEKGREVRQPAMG